jgi:hypothetical protein
MVPPGRCAPVVWLRNAGMYEPGHPPPGSLGYLHALPPPPRYVCARREEPGLAVQLPAPGASIFIGSGGLQDGSGRTIGGPSGTARKIGRKSAGENFRGFIPLLRLPLRPGTGASRFFFLEPKMLFDGRPYARRSGRAQPIISVVASTAWVLEVSSRGGNLT